MIRLERWTRRAVVFLSVSYGIGAPLTAFLEYESGKFSERFGYPPELIYLTCLVQAIGSAGILVRSLAPWAAAGLTVITIGAIVSHLRIQSPLAAVPAILYTAVQIWVGLRSRGSRAPAPSTSTR